MENRYPRFSARHYAIGAALASAAFAIALLITAGAAKADYTTCPDGKIYPANLRVCPDNITVPVYHPDAVQAIPAPPAVQEYFATHIKPFYAQPVHVMTLAELKALDVNLEREAAILARKWSANGPLNSLQMNYLHLESCVLVAASNSDVRCVYQP